MSFFFTDIKSKPVKDEQIAKEHGCAVCPLMKLENKTKDMQPTGTTKPIVYFVGEAPGKTEDIENKQFVGSAGVLLRDELYKIISEYEADNIIRWNNCVRCRPYIGNKNRPPEKFEIECCKHSLFKDIEETKPLIVVGFGGVPLKVFTDGNKIGQWRGRFIPIKVGNHVCWYYPVYHPSFINRKKESNKNAYGESQYEICFRTDLQDLFLFVSNYKGPEYIGSGYDEGISIILGDKEDDFDQILTQLAKFACYPYIAVDLETVGRRIQSKDFKMISISIGTDTDVVVFPLDHPKAWNFGNREENIKKLYGMLSRFIAVSQGKIAHHLKFEAANFLREFGESILRNNEWHDTMVQAYLLNEKTSKEEGMLSLDRMIQLNFGFNLKELTGVDRKNPLKSTLNELLIYNGMDSKYTYKLFMRQKDKVKEEGFEDIYNSLIKTTITLAVTEGYGIVVDMDKVNEFEKKYEGELKELLDKMKELPEVRQFGIDRFNPLAPEDLIFIFKEIMGIELTEKTKESLSTNDKVLTKLMKEGVKLAEYILAYRSMNKLKSTYVDNIKAMAGKGSIVHPNYNHLYTETGRFSSGKE